MPKKDEVEESATMLLDKPIAVPGREAKVSVDFARKVMARITEEAADLREDDSNAAKTRRIEIARQLRAIQVQIDRLDEEVEVLIPANASKQFPFRIGPKEFMPGTHRVRGQVAMILRHMMDQHQTVEQHIHVAGGNVDPQASGMAAYGKELPAI